MRYYLIRIAYNKIAKAEDRPQPTAYDTLDEAKKAFHNFFAQNILGSTIGWCMAMVVNPYGVIVDNLSERWEEPVEPETEVTASESV